MMDKDSHTDAAAAANTTTPLAVDKAGRTIQFPWKMHILLSETVRLGQQDIVSWLPNGKSFKVFDKKRFAHDVMPVYFNSSTYKSFQRNLNVWGFESTISGIDMGAMSHPYFVRGRPELCHKMVRVSVKGQHGVAGTCSSPPTTAVPSTSVQDMVRSGLEEAREVSAPTQQPFRSSTISFLEQRQVQQHPAPMPSSFLLGQDVLSSLEQQLLLHQEHQRKAAAAVVGPSSQLSALSSLLSPIPPQQTPTPIMDIILKQALQERQHAIDQQLRQSCLDRTGGLLGATSQRHPLEDLSAGGLLQTQSHIEKITQPKVPSYLPSHSIMGSKLLANLPPPGARMIPCRARGMPLDHNGRTAAFEVYEDTPHGADLICSHAGCQAEGIKFRYCRECDLPVAKRSFSTLHSHATGKQASNSQNSTIDSNEDTSAKGPSDVMSKNTPATSSLHTTTDRPSQSPVLVVPITSQVEPSLPDKVETKEPAKSSLCKKRPSETVSPSSFIAATSHSARQWKPQPTEAVRRWLPPLSQDCPVPTATLPPTDSPDNSDSDSSLPLKKRKLGDESPPKSRDSFKSSSRTMDWIQKCLQKGGPAPFSFPTTAAPAQSGKESVPVIKGSKPSFPLPSSGVDSTKQAVPSSGCTSE